MGAAVNETEKKEKVEGGTKVGKTASEKKRALKKFTE